MSLFGIGGSITGFHIVTFPGILWGEGVSPPFFTRGKSIMTLPVGIAAKVFGMPRASATTWAQVITFLSDVRKPAPDITPLSLEIRTMDDLN